MSLTTHSSPAYARSADIGTVLNDVHSGLNPTSVTEIATPRSLHELQEILCSTASGHRPPRDGDRDGRILSFSGGRHAMGGQQFADDSLHVDLRGLDRILSFDPERGIVEVEAGIQWPAFLEGLRQRQRRRDWIWTFAQKPTGADRLTLGGCLGANIHGRGLGLAPLIQDTESITLLRPSGEAVTCSRRHEPQLFRLAIGGYGLFGPIYSVALRLVPRRKLERVVEIESAGHLLQRFQERIAAGFLYGDFQFDIDSSSSGFLDRGVFSCYRPVDSRRPIATDQRSLSEEQWLQLLQLAHTDKSEAFERYADHYLSTHGQLYWSDSAQMTPYRDDYHRQLDLHLPTLHAGSEMITELFVPRPALAHFLRRAATELRAREAEVIYGTVRLVERDRESSLAWARQPWACVVFNLHVRHTAAGLAKAAADFRRLIDIALACGGSFYLTYHRWATSTQAEAAHPRLRTFLQWKRRFDPDERFQSEWYRHYRNLFAGHQTPAAE